jgi:hypothetical protein
MLGMPGAMCSVLPSSLAFPSGRLPRTTSPTFLTTSLMFSFVLSPFCSTSAVLIPMTSSASGTVPLIDISLSPAVVVTGDITFSGRLYELVRLCGGKDCRRAVSASRFAAVWKRATSDETCSCQPKHTQDSEYVAWTRRWMYVMRDQGCALIY